MKFLHDMFSESSDISMMRVMALLSLLIGGYLAIKGLDTSVMIFVTAAFSGKATQKYFELMSTPKVEKELKDNVTGHKTNDPKAKSDKR